MPLMFWAGDFIYERFTLKGIYLCWVQKESSHKLVWSVLAFDTFEHFCPDALNATLAWAQSFSWVDLVSLFLKLFLQQTGEQYCGL